MKAIISALVLTATIARPDTAAADDPIGYLYSRHCSGCHGMEGTGSKIGRIPPFKGVVGKFVKSDEGRLYLVHVPGLANAALSDEDTAKLLNYVLRTWGRPGGPTNASDFTPDEVHRLRSIHVDDVAALRRKLSKRDISAGY